MQRSFLAALLALSCAASQAQLFGDSSDPDWREADAPPPPALRTDGLIAVELPRSELRFGVDPASVHVGKDGVVHYVVVATSASGVVNGVYEGIRCASGEVKVYARHTPGAGWVRTKESEWRSVRDASARHSLAIARAGACVGRVPNLSAAQVTGDLRNAGQPRYR